MNDTISHRRMDRRSAVKWMLAATATVRILDTETWAQGEPAQSGYGTDPSLLSGEVFWDRTLTPRQLRTAGVLSDIILPHVEESSPSASELKVPDFIDEWVSAPYPNQQADRTVILDGLAWVDRESQARFKKNFVELSHGQQLEICDDVCYQNTAKVDFETGARFFTKFRNLTLGGYYTTEVGMRDVGYVGNVALASFDGPPPEVLERLGLDQAPW